MQTEQADAALTLNAIRELFIERMWLCMCGYALLAIPLLLWRSAAIGGGMLHALPLVALALLAIGATLFRKRLPRRLRVALPPLLLIAGGLAGLGTTGLQGSGMISVVFGCVCAMTMYPARIGAAVIVLCWACAIVIAAGFVSGMLRPPFGMEFASNPMNWAGTILTTVLLTAFISSAVAAYQNSTGALLRQLEQQRDQIAALANHDALTGLPSMRLARDRIDMACSLAKRSGARVAVLFVDLDDFKRANDDFGHEAGDLVLRTVAERLRSVLRATDTAARIGGDEFLVVLNGIGAHEAVTRAAEKIIEAMALPIEFGNAVIHIGASVGIALFPEHGQSADMLLRHADSAMYRVKKSGKNGYALFQLE
jgi:diguanylate cyclase (GGDEF)-like protein